MEGNKDNEAGIRATLAKHIVNGTLAEIEKTLRQSPLWRMLALKAINDFVLSGVKGPTSPERPSLLQHLPVGDKRYHNILKSKEFLHKLMGSLRNIET